MGLNDLPNEIVFKIFRYLSIEDLGNWTKVSKRFRNVCLDKALPSGKMKNVFRKDMSQKDLEDSLAKKTKMIRKLKIEELQKKRQEKKRRQRYLQKQQGQLLRPADQLGQANPILMASYLKDWKQQQQQRQGQPRPAGQSGHDSIANQPRPIVQSLQKLVTTLKNPNFKNTHQQNWQVQKILKSNPNLVAAFLKQRKQQQGDPSSQ